MLLHDTDGPHTVGVEADYIDGDPAEPGPITGGTLTLDSRGLLFRGRTGQGELRVDLGDLEGMTVSGARPRATGAKQHGTTRVAAYRNQVPTVLQFGIDRSKAAVLRDRINSALLETGRPELPFVEALYEFEVPPPPIEMEENGAGGAAPPPRRVTPRKPAKVYRPRNRQNLIVFGVIAGVVSLEIAVTLLVLFVF